MTCPHCNAPISYHALHAHFSAREYPTYFDWDCPHCGETIAVEVHAIPDFQLNAPACPYTPPIGS